GDQPPMSTTQPTTTIGKAANFAETRVGASVLVREFGRKIFPSHWSFMLGEVALYSFIIVVLSGTFLTFFFQPAMGEMHYEGPWLPLRGVEISEAYNSTLAISLEIRVGLFIRQMHHWGALLFVAALSVHMLRVFFTGAFRRPRELNWVVGVLLVIMGMAAGFTGYSLPDDLLSGNGLRIIDGILKSLPLVGTYVSFFLFGGEFPGVDIVARLYTLHIMIVPRCRRRGTLLRLVLPLRRRVPRRRHRGATVHPPHHDRAGSAHRAHRHPPGVRGRAQAHAVPRCRKHREERRRRARAADIRGEGRRILLPHLRTHLADLGTVHDQPDLDLRSLGPLPGLGRHSARLVHRLCRRVPQNRAGLVRVLHLRLADLVQHQQRCHRHGRCLRGDVHLPVLRGVAAQG